MEDRKEYSLSSFRQIPTIKPKKISDNPFYALQMHKRKTTPRQIRNLDNSSIVSKQFPKREFKRCLRSKTIADTNSKVELPKINERRWEPKKAHMYYNLNFLISQTKRGLITLQY